MAEEDEGLQNGGQWEEEEEEDEEEGGGGGSRGERGDFGARNIIVKSLKHKQAPTQSHNE